MKNTNVKEVKAEVKEVKVIETKAPVTEEKKPIEVSAVLGTPLPVEEKKVDVSVKETATKKEEKEKKVSKREHFEMLRAIVTASVSKDKKELLEFIDHEIDLLESKKSRLKESATRATHEPIMDAIREVLKGKTEPMQIAEMLKDSRLASYKEKDEVKEMSPQKLSAMLKRLVDGGEVERKVIKKHSYFILAK